MIFLLNAKFGISLQLPHRGFSSENHYVCYMLNKYAQNLDSLKLYDSHTQFNQKSQPLLGTL